jgi:N6-L-threonylcarbamoyladenine synthase
MIVLGLETSCDETAASVVNDRGEILSNIVLSQLKTHRVYGGVVPEIAAREHLEHIDKVITAALEDAGVTFTKLDGVAATCGPGLIGGVMIGMMSAKAIAAVHNIPFLAVNHLEGHLLTARLTDKIEFPYLVLLVSGGHTQLLIAEKLGSYKRIGTTLDDAAGECFDKSAKLMGLPYPGGPHIEQIAKECKDPDAAIKRFPLPFPMKDKKGCDFSFSGLKTAVRLHVDNLPEGDLNREDIAQLSCALEIKIAEILANKSARAINQFKEMCNQPKSARALVVCGGVSANKEIAKQLQTVALQNDMTFHAPPLSLSGDNGAMIAWAGMEKLLASDSDFSGDPLNFKARPRWPLDPSAPKRHGAGVKA